MISLVFVASHVIIYTALSACVRVIPPVCSFQLVIEMVKIVGQSMH